MHTEILDSKRNKLLESLLPHINGFILGGGTALALQLGHRQSFDFDFFCSSKIPIKLLETLSSFISIHTVSVDTINELTIFTNEELKLTFLNYPFKNAFDPIEVKENLFLFSVKDIAVKKAYTIGRRGEYRDYFDLYTILKKNIISLEEVINTAQQIYGSAFEEKIFLQQLTYFDDLLDFNIIPVGEALLPDKAEVRAFFEDMVEKFIFSK